MMYNSTPFLGMQVLFWNFFNFFQKIFFSYKIHNSIQESFLALLNIFNLYLDKSVTIMIIYISVIQQKLYDDRIYYMQSWRNWHTRMIQVHVDLRPWGFNSLRLHWLMRAPNACKSSVRSFLVILPPTPYNSRFFIPFMISWKKT